MTLVSTTPGQTLVALYSDNEVVATTLPVDLPTDTFRTILRVVVPVVAGDVLDVSARAGVTNDNSYNIGVGFHLWAYDADSGQGSSGPWWRISNSSGDNVDRQRHHLPLYIDTVYKVPDDWPDGHRIVVALRADAHSDAWQAGDVIRVEPNRGLLKVRRWSTARP